MLLTASQAAELAGVTRERIYAAVRQGWLTPAEGVPIICFSREQVIAFRDRDKPKGGRGKKIRKE